MAMAGTGIMNSNLQNAAKYYPPGGQQPGVGMTGANPYDQSKQTNGEVLAGIRGTTNLGVSPQKVDQYNSQNKRGSEFKKSA